MSRKRRQDGHRKKELSEGFLVHVVMEGFPEEVAFKQKSEWVKKQAMQVWGEDHSRQREKLIPKP